MKNLVATTATEAKLKSKHNVTLAEVRQCFLNRKWRLLIDSRALTRTNPPTLWFIADTNKVRTLKIVYIREELRIILKTAYEPNEEELAIYRLYGGT